jgi:transketolase
MCVEEDRARLDQLSINTIRTLSIDAAERAKSGHPGTPMALAPRTARWSPKAFARAWSRCRRGRSLSGYVGSAGRVIGMWAFGASAPLKALQEEFGFEPEPVVASAKELLGMRGERMVAS